MFSFQSSPSVFFLSAEKVKSATKRGSFPELSKSREAWIWPQVPPHVSQIAITGSGGCLLPCFRGWEAL